MRKPFALRSYLVIALCLCGIFATAQKDTAGVWTWIHGDNTGNPTAIYGMPGVPAPANTPEAVGPSWLDNESNLWVMSTGSNANHESISELWKYDRNIHQWTFVKGSTSPLGIYGNKGVSDETCFPGSRYGAVTWVDHNGNFWLFGGNGKSSETTGDGFGDLSDLWMFNPNLKTWTWMAGDKIHNFTAFNDQPAMRAGAIGWIDNDNNLWLMGGIQNYFGWRNELWKYSIATNHWTMVRGNLPSISSRMAPVYGEKGIPSPANTPGGISNAVTWTDSVNNLWLYGGNMVTPEGVQSYTENANTVWKYNIASDQWTWVAGNKDFHKPAVYGQLGVASPDAHPGNRSSPFWAADKNGNIFLYGGIVNKNVDEYGPAADLWKFDISTLQWTWLSGTRQLDQPAVYGQRWSSHFGNTPGGRSNGILWVPNDGEIYLMGDGHRNDLWKFTAVRKIFYADKDGDGYGDASKPITAVAELPGYVSNNKDCNDNNAGAYPGGPAPCETSTGFTVKLAPNPCISHCRLTVSGGIDGQPFEVRVLDFQHQLRDRRKQLFAGETFSFGNNISTGIYFVEVSQGAERKIIKLLKR